VIPSGETRILHRRAVPIFDDAGTPVSVIGMSQDVTERKRVEDELRNRDALLSQAEQLANLGSWDWNLETSQVVWSDHRYRLLGFDPETQTPDVDAFWKRVHPEDLDRVRREFDAAERERRPVEYEARFVLPDGTVRTLHSRGVPILNSEGRVVRLRGMAQDVTERRGEEERLRHSEALLAHAEEIANVGSWEFDVVTRHTLLSRHLVRMYGLKDESEWDLELYWKRLQTPDAGAIRSEVARSVKQGLPFEFTAPYIMPDGTVRIYHTVGKPVLGRHGTAIKVLGVVHDITEHTRIEEDLRRLSQQLIHTRDNERRQLARGLHETAGQTLASLKMTLGNLEELLPEDNTSAQEQLKTARGFAEDAVREIRLVSYLMYPPLLNDAGLAPAVSWYVRGFSERSGIRATVEITTGAARYSQEIETTVFSIVQEALTNVHRYSGSASVNVRLNPEGDTLRAEIEDYGSGLPVMAPAKGQPSGFGVGIAAMRERVKELNGSFEILSTPGRGTLVRAILPVSRQQSAESLSSSANGSNPGTQRRKGKITADSHR
jgi:PAS domain S-box-containing protein